MKNQAHLSAYARWHGYSKHQRFDTKGKWRPGRCIIATNSGIRKRARAARRAA